jgi:uncharacterized protein (DUF1330 family)
MLLITVGHVHEGGMAALAQYAEGVLPLIAAAGGEVVVRGRPEETLVGSVNRHPDLVAVIRFPDAEAIRRFLASDAYHEYVRYRDAAFAELHSYLASELFEETSH